MQKTIFPGAKKIGVEKSIRDLVQQADEYAAQFDQCLDTACDCLKAGRSEDAIELLNKAIEEETRTKDILDDIRKMEKTLVYLLGKQIRRETEGQR